MTFDSSQSLCFKGKCIKIMYVQQRNSIMGKNVNLTQLSWTEQLHRGRYTTRGVRRFIETKIIRSNVLGVEVDWPSRLLKLYRFERTDLWQNPISKTIILISDCTLWNKWYTDCGLWWGAVRRLNAVTTRQSGAELGVLGLLFFWTTFYKVINKKWIIMSRVPRKTKFFYRPASVFHSIMSLDKR